ncbi:MAG: spore photoproduct lyase family protein, partial [Bacteroidota bacterium]
PIKPENDLRFEIVAHRFTPRAKQTILEVYPATTLEMNESKRKWKWGQFGYGKYVYDKQTYEEITSFFTAHLRRLFPEATLDYIV